MSSKAVAPSQLPILFLQILDVQIGDTQLDFERLNLLLELLPLFRFLFLRILNILYPATNKEMKQIQRTYANSA
jgi:hypothetical protein